MSTTLAKPGITSGNGPLQPDALRVLHVTEAACAGVGGHVLDLVEGLPRHNCELHLIYSPDRIDEPFQARVSDNQVAKFFTINMRRAPRLHDFQLARRIKSYIQQHGPFDVIHAHSTKAGGLTRFPFFSFQSKNVYTPNGIFTMNPTLGSIPRFIAKRIELTLARKSHAIIAVSPEEKQHMLEIGLPASKVKMIANGISQRDWPSKQVTRHELGLDPSAIVIGFLGRLANQKNPTLMIEAFARLHAANNVRLVMVGTGPLEKHCRQLSERLGLESRIDWLGFKTAEQAMPAFDVFVMPSQYEGMPYVMMEAMSIGLPIVATQVGGTSIGIEDGVNGFVVPRSDSDTLATRLQHLIDNQQTRLGFSEASKQRAMQFSVAQMVIRTRELYDSLLSRKNESF